MNRRSFFQGLAKAAAIVALAPELCFRARLELPERLLLQNNCGSITRASIVTLAPQDIARLFSLPRQTDDQCEVLLDEMMVLVKQKGNV